MSKDLSTARITSAAQFHRSKDIIGHYCTPEGNSK